MVREARFSWNDYDDAPFADRRARFEPPDDGMDDFAPDLPPPPRRRNRDRKRLQPDGDRPPHRKS